MKLAQAKEIVKNAMNKFAGFECVLDDGDMQCFAGCVKNLGWGEDELFNAFKSRYTAKEITGNSGKRVLC